MKDRAARSALPAGAASRELVQKALALDVIPIGYRIGYLAQLFTGPLYRALDETQGIGRQEWVVLFCTTHFDQLTAQDIAEMSGRAKANVSRAVNKLLRMALVQRRPDPADARRALIDITPKGRALFDVTLAPFVNRETQMLSVLEADEIRELDRILRKLTTRDDGWDAPY
jgi:DNA-binding MarR family transcriptional regulator